MSVVLFRRLAHAAPSPKLTCLLLAASAVLAACGGGGGGEATTAPTAQEASGPAPLVASADSAGPPATVAQPESKQALAAEIPADSVAPVATTTPAPAEEPAPATAPAPAPVTAAAPAPAPTVTAPEADATAAAPSAAVLPINFYVATDGNDAWSGTLPRPNIGRTDGPVKTIGAAQALVRQRIASTGATTPRRPINVRIAAGEYRLSAPLVFGPSDSGVPGAPVVYQAEAPGSVNISGALDLGTRTGPAAGALMTLPAPALDATNMRGATQLYVNGRRATLARTPNAGSYWFVQKAVPLATEPTGQVGQEAFTPQGNAASVIAGLNAAERSQGVLMVMQAWSAGHHRVSADVAPAGAIRITPRAHWPFLKFGTDQRFYLENVSSALDAPGEWVWDASGLRYISTAADAGRPVSFEMPQTERLLIVQGNSSTKTWVQDLEFRGLGFSHTRLLTPDAGFVDGQAGSTLSAAIEVDAARRIVIDSCSVTRTGGYGVWLRTAVRDSRVSNCTMKDLGGGGVKIGLTAQAPSDADGTGMNTVHANIITDTGKQVPGSVGIWVGQSSDNVVSNNLVANTSYTAISLGWSWSYGTSTAARNRVTDNLLLNIGQGEMSDMGAIYTLGESPGTVISGNVVHEVRPYTGYGAGAWGLYNDEATTGVLWERNVVVGTDAGGYLLHYGRNNTVRTNLLAYGDRGEVRVTRSDPLTNLGFTGNLLIPKVGTPFVAYATAPDVVYSGNAVSSRVLSTPADIAKCGAGCARSDATLTVGSDPRVLTLAGASADTIAWVAAVGLAAGPPGLAASAIPPVNADPPPIFVAPPVAYEADIAGATVGAVPVNMFYRYGGIPTSISVQAAAGAPGGKGLRFADSASATPRWEPYAWAVLNHRNGTTSGEFSIMIDANSNFLHEWRDDASVYLTGPSLRVKPTGIEVAGKVVAPAPVGQWITVKITAPLDSTGGTWTLQVVYASGQPTVTVGNLAFKSAGWKRLNWLGFVSDANVSSTATIGHVRALNNGT